MLWRVESRGQEAVLKLSLDAGQVRSRREFDGQTLLAPFGLAPPPLWLDRIPETLPRSVLVYRWVAGEPFDAARFVGGRGVIADQAEVAAAGRARHIGERLVADDFDGIVAMRAAKVHQFRLVRGKVMYTIAGVYSEKS